MTANSGCMWSASSGKKNKFGHFLVVVQLIHRLTQADISSLVLFSIAWWSGTQPRTVDKWKDCLRQKISHAKTSPFRLDRILLWLGCMFHMVVTSDPDAIYDVMMRRFEAAYLPLPQIMGSILIMDEISQVSMFQCQGGGKSHTQI